MKVYIIASTCWLEIVALSIGKTTTLEPSSSSGCFDRIVIRQVLDDGAAETADFAAVMQSIFAHLHEASDALGSRTGPARRSTLIVCNLRLEGLS